LFAGERAKTFLSEFALSIERSKEGFGFFLSFVFCPADRGGVPEDVFEAGVGTAIEEETDDVEVACGDGLMQRRGVRMASDGVVAIWILAGSEQDADDFGFAELRC